MMPFSPHLLPPNSFCPNYNPYMGGMNCLDMDVLSDKGGPIYSYAVRKKRKKGHVRSLTAMRSSPACSGVLPVTCLRMPHNLNSSACKIGPTSKLHLSREGDRLLRFFRFLRSIGGEGIGCEQAAASTGDLPSGLSQKQTTPSPPL
jgi:hypothetical protein